MSTLHFGKVLRPVSPGHRTSLSVHSVYIASLVWLNLSCGTSPVVPYLRQRLESRAPDALLCVELSMVLQPSIDVMLHHAAAGGTTDRHSMASLRPRAARAHVLR
ncbi:unnamed protein product [Cercospora beticola]|nr:unnamed protein product [Cercospora beticola]